MTGRFVGAVSVTALILLAWVAGQSDVALVLILCIGSLLALRWDRVQMRKHRRRMAQERLEPTMGRRR